MIVSVVSVCRGSEGNIVAPPLFSLTLNPPRPAAVDFDTKDHGYMVGARGTFAETNDGGLTWQARSFTNLDAEEEVREA